MDVLAVKAAGQMAVDHVKAGKGPILLEMNTYRYRGHSMSDPATYRSKEEVDGMKSHNDPIEAVKVLLEKEHGIKAEDLKALDKETREICKKAAEFSLESPLPEAKELYTDILIETAEEKTSASPSTANTSNSNDINW